MSDVPAASWRQLLEPRYLLAISTICLGIVLHALNIPLTATVLPSAVREIGGLAFLSWAATVYLVASLLTSVSGTRLRRRFGPRRAYFIAGALFAAGSLTCGLSPSMPVMLLGRTLQGAGGGLILSLGYALIRGHFPDALWARIFALVSGIWGTAAILGAFVGGIFADLFSWRGAYLVMLPLALVLIGLAQLGFPGDERLDGADGRYPWRRLLLLGGAILAVAASGNLAEPAWRIALIVAALPPTVLALRLDARASVRLLPRDAFSLRSMTGTGLWIVFLMMLALNPIGVYGPVLLQTLHGLAATTAGAFVAWNSVSWTLAALVVASWPAAPERPIMIAGPVLMVAGLLGLAALVPTGPVLALVPLVFAVGGGIGLGWAFLCKRVMSFAHEDDGDIAASAIPTTQMFGFAFGAALAGLVANAAGFSEGLSAATAIEVAHWLFAAFALAPVAAALAALRLAQLERRLLPR